MARKIMLIVCLFSLSLVLGCQDEEKSASQEKGLKHKQAKALEYSIAATCEGCDLSWAVGQTPRDMVIARNPGLDNQQLYLTVVDKDGKTMECCKKPMRIVVENDGTLALYCPHCGKLKPVAVKGDKVMVE